MSLLKRHRLIWLFLGLVLSTLVALFVVYDVRSPVGQFVRGYGTVPVDRWTAADLEAACIRLEPTQATPLLWADAAVPGLAPAGCRPPPGQRQSIDPPAPSLSLIHISEPTRLGMISYAVFCLKKK